MALTININVHHHFPALEGIQTAMSRLTDATDALIAEVTDSTTKLDSIETFIRGVPALVSAAVTQALADANVADDAAAAAVEQATSEISGKVDEALGAIDANTPPEPTA